MKAGRKLDALIAKKIFCSEFEFDETIGDFIHRFDAKLYTTCPNYSTDEEAAREVSHRLDLIWRMGRSCDYSGYSISFLKNEKSLPWEIKLWDRYGRLKETKRVETLAFGTCLVALEVVKSLNAQDFYTYGYDPDL
jgi:hypothetical protein